MRKKEEQRQRTRRERARLVFKIRESRSGYARKTRICTSFGCESA